MAMSVTKSIIAVTVLGPFLLLVFLEDMTRSSYIHGKIVKRSWNNYNRPSSLNYDQFGRLNTRNENTLEGNEMYPVHWNTSNNVHKKKQYPRSWVRYGQETLPRRTRYPKTSSALNRESTRSARLSSQTEHPTLRPSGNFNALEDVERLRALLRSKVIDDVGIINIMTKRTDEQRKQIIQLYPDLKKDFGWKLSFGFRELMRALATPLHEFHAEQLKEAFRFSTKYDEDLLVELLCTWKNSQLQSVRQAYQRLYRKEISDELRKFPQNPFLNFLISYTQGNRDEKRNIDQRLATYDAEQLKLSGKLTLNNGSPLWNVFIYRSYPQLKLTLSEYKRITGKSIRENIRKDFSGNTQKGLINIVKTIEKRPQYFAEILNSGIRNFSKRDTTLIRIILLRAEIDMEDIKTAYNQMYHLPLAASIPTNTGSLKKGLISLIAV